MPSVPHRRRVDHAVPLVRNVREYLLGSTVNQNPSPEVVATSRIAEWWREGWLRGRIFCDAVPDEVARHTLARPIRHRARAVSAARKDKLLLFPEVP